MTTTEIKNLIKKISGLNVKDFNKIEGGESFVYILTLSDNSRVVLKLPIKSSLNYSFEAYAYTILQQNNVLAPRCLKTGDNFILTSLVEGHEIEDNPELFLNKSILREAAINVKRCHNIKLQGFGRNKDLDSWESFLDINTLLSESRELLDEKDYRQIKDYIDSNKSIINIEQGVLVHGDLCLQHVFSHNNQFSGLIDFGDSFVGDPLIDIAYFKFKEINKTYSRELYDTFSEFYFSPAEFNQSTTIKLNIYMIYWGLKRIIQNRGTLLETKFKAKVKIVIDSL